MAQPDCRGVGHQADMEKCFVQWPNYPCYHERTRACYNEEGTEQLFDPMADLSYALSQGYIAALETIGHLSGQPPSDNVRAASAAEFHNFLFPTLIAPRITGVASLGERGPLGRANPEAIAYWTNQVLAESARRYRAIARSIRDRCRRFRGQQPAAPPPGGTRDERRGGGGRQNASLKSRTRRRKRTDRRGRTRSKRGGLALGELKKGQEYTIVVRRDGKQERWVGRVDYDLGDTVCFEGVRLNDQGAVQSRTTMDLFAYKDIISAIPYVPKPAQASRIPEAAGVRGALRSARRLLDERVRGRRPPEAVAIAGPAPQLVLGSEARAAAPAGVPQIIIGPGMLPETQIPEGQVPISPEASVAAIMRTVRGSLIQRLLRAARRKLTRRRRGGRKRKTRKRRNRRRSKNRSSP